VTDVFSRCAAWKEDRAARLLGFYPYYQALGASDTGAEAMLGSRRVIMIGSNNYIGLADDPRVKEAASAATQKYGSTCSGSRLLNGTRDLHEELEHRLARFLKREAVVCVSTGFQPNLAALTAVLGRKDIAFSDRRNHASLVDGVALSRAIEKRYRHDHLETLESQLAAADKSAGKLIISDAVFSMEGDLCNLPRLVDLKKHYRVRLLLDDAHGIGVLGANGRGTAEYFDLEAETDSSREPSPRALARSAVS
jgi:7-keto-8-aminopelargonate synthetase-like enzyme